MARGFNAFMRHIRDEQADTMISFRSTEPPNPVKGVFFVFAGIIVFIVAVFMGIAQYDFLAQAKKAPGIVKSLNAGGSHPEIEFTSSSGQVVSYPQGGMIFGYEPGQAVEVLYNPENPRRSPEVNDIGGLWGMAAMVAVIGLGFIWGGADDFFSWRKNARRGSTN